MKYIQSRQVFDITRIHWPQKSARTQNTRNQIYPWHKSQYFDRNVSDFCTGIIFELSSGFIDALHTDFKVPPQTIITNLHYEITWDYKRRVALIFLDTVRFSKSRVVHGFHWNSRMEDRAVLLKPKHESWGATERAHHVNKPVDPRTVLIVVKGRLVLLKRRTPHCDSLTAWYSLMQWLVIILWPVTRPQET